MPDWEYEQTLKSEKRISDRTVAWILIACVFLLVLCSNALAPFLGSGIGGAVFFVLLGLGSYWLVMNRFGGYRYVLNQRGLLALRLVGRKERLIECVLLEEMCALLPVKHQTDAAVLLAAPKGKANWRLEYQRDGKRSALLLCPDERMLSGLHRAMARKDNGNE